MLNLIRFASPVVSYIHHAYYAVFVAAQKSTVALPEWLNPPQAWCWQLGCEGNRGRWAPEIVFIYPTNPSKLSNKETFQEFLEEFCWFVDAWRILDTNPGGCAGTVFVALSTHFTPLSPLWENEARMEGVWRSTAEVTIFLDSHIEAISC